MSYDPLVSGPTHFVDTFRVLSAANLRRCAQYSVRAHDLDLEPGDWTRVLSIVCADMCLDLTTAHAMKRNANKVKSTVQRMTRAFYWKHDIPWTEQSDHTKMILSEQKEKHDTVMILHTQRRTLVHIKYNRDFFVRMG